MSDLIKNLKDAATFLDDEGMNYKAASCRVAVAEIERTKFIEDAAVILVAKLQEIGDPTLSDEVHDLHEALWGRPPTEANKISSVSETPKHWLGLICPNVG